MIITGNLEKHKKVHTNLMGFFFLKKILISFSREQIADTLCSIA